MQSIARLNRVATLGSRISRRKRCFDSFVAPPSKRNQSPSKTQPRPPRPFPISNPRTLLNLKQPLLLAERVRRLEQELSLERAAKEELTALLRAAEASAAAEREARAAAEARLGDARERGSRVEGRLLPRIEAAARAVEEAEARMQELRDGSGNGNGNGGGDEEAEEEEEEENENAENEAPAARGGGGGGKRRAPLQLEASKTPQGAAAGASKGNNNKRMRKMAG